MANNNIITTRNNIELIGSLNLSVSFNPELPGSFISMYRYLLGRGKPNRNRSLISMTTRLIAEFSCAKNELEKIASAKTMGLLSWIKNKNKEKILKKKVIESRRKLIHWVSKTISFYIK